MGLLKPKPSGGGALLEESTPSFGAIWKAFITIATTVAGAALVGLFTWIWNVDNELTRLVTRVDGNARAIESLATIPTAVATIQATQSLQQSTNQNALLQISDRIRMIEQEQRWRDRAARGGGGSGTGR